MRTPIRQGLFARFHPVIGQRFFTLLLCAAATMALGMAGVSHAQSQAQSPKSAPVAGPVEMTEGAAPGLAQAASTAAKPAGGLHQGIKVHGHWVIEVRNPDGKLAARREFENSLTSVGPHAISEILSGWAVAGGWYITLTDPKATVTGTPCRGSPNPKSYAGVCFILQPTSTYDIAPQGTALCASASGPCSNNLALSLTSSGGLVLTGSIEATQSGNIGAVFTNLVFCDPATATAPSPGNLPFYKFTPTQCAVGTDTAGLSDANIKGLVITGVNLDKLTSSQCGGANQPSCPLTGIQANQWINVSVTITFQ
ncbi:MAG: hypothetical protein WCF17_09715 [Terracidiphilus sp.]